MGISGNNQDLENSILTVLESVRPTIQLDGGDIEFVRFEAGTVFVRLTGACVGCPASIYTLQLGVQQALAEKIPEVTGVSLVEEA